MRIAAAVLLCFLVGCVRGAPYLTEEQETKVRDVKIYKLGEAKAELFNIVGEIKAADCTGPMGSRFAGKEELALAILKQKAVALNAMYVIDVNCYHAPFVQNCWAAAVCDGKAANLK